MFKDREINRQPDRISQFQNPAKQEPIFDLESSRAFHVKETLSVLKELLSAQPVFREQLLMATKLSVVGYDLGIDLMFHATGTY